MIYQFVISLAKIAPTLDGAPKTEAMLMVLCRIIYR
jgi:hypothetical protein